ncbi:MULTISPECIES: formimidoylglutamase [Galbibacter]|uniref:Formimidoylglutamase n=1 Tax=Galbibacter pacificus TaxID=2996052 RepID=A0ABT6FW28_9FLAO|nr:formimidoylglutamase [Galbibacter pacificus]MDG3584091.1 formimidoylglutamase [Galbibacter pacificus]MDG3587476.1 formimidoylglutamase [Galbibacter pacificus]
MNVEFLSPVKSMVLAHNELLPKQALGRTISIHTEKEGFPGLENIQIAIIGINESRSEHIENKEEVDLASVRLEFYKLFAGNWHGKIADLGDIQPGNTLTDTYYAVSSIVADLLKKNIIPIIIGGSQDLTYAAYRAYDKMEQMVNLVSIDSKFDFSASDELITESAYMSKIIMEQPNNLFNFSTVGYQTYFNAQEEIDLMEKLFFDAYRLGEVVNDITIVEPVFRDADLVSLDVTAIKAAELGHAPSTHPNGFDGREICAIARYAGISDKVTAFGVFNYKNTVQCAQLTSQILWYFIEGYNFRKKDYPFTSIANYVKYIVPLDDMDICFFKSNISGRWWIEVPQIENLNNKLKRHTLLPCTHKEYLEASNGVVPERWWKAYKKMLV